MFCSMHNMVVSCVAVGCTNYYGKRNASFYRFPADLELREKWIAAINRADVHDNKKKWRPTPYCRLCSEHFVGGRISHDPRSPAYIPTIFSDVTSPKRKRHFVNKCEVNCDQNKKCTTKVEPFQPEKVIMISESGDAIEEFSSFPNYSSTEVPMKQEANANSDEGNEIDEQPVINNDTLSSDETVAVPSFQIKDETMEIITKCEEDYLSSAEDYGNCYSTVDQGGAENLGNDDNSKEINGSEKVDIEMKDVDDMSDYSMKNHSFDGVKREVFSCRLCFYKTTYLYKLREHFQIHKGEKLFACQHCPYQSNHKWPLLTHGLTHSTDKKDSFQSHKKCPSFNKATKEKAVKIKKLNKSAALSCSHCFFEASDSGSLMYHILTHARQNSLTCKLCPFVGSNLEILLSHISSHKDAAEPTVGDVEQFSCDKCTYKTNSNLSLNEHYATHAGKMLFSCDLCPFQTTGVSRMQIYSDKKSHSCQCCSFRTSNKTSLRKHIMTHRTEAMFSCTFCTYKTMCRRNLDVHIFHHEGRMLSCKSCSFQTKSKAEFQEHCLIHNESVPTSNNCSLKVNTEDALANSDIRHTKKRPFSCEFCPFESVYKSNLKQHLSTHPEYIPKLAKPTLNRVSRAEKVILKPPSSEAIYSCAACLFKTSHRRSLRRHVLRHEKMFSCSVCHYRTTCDDKLREHSCPPATFFSCQLCNYKNTKKTRLKRHMTVHSDEKPFVCNVCPFKSKYSNGLKKHILTHTPMDLPYSCDLCSFKSVKRTNLVEHKLIHTGEKKYLCDICSYQSIRQSSFKNHLLKHTGERPHACNLCPFKTALKSGLKRHMKIHQ